MRKAYLGIELGSTRIKAVGVAEKILSDMLGIPVSARATAGEGGAWGIAKLAACLTRGRA